jgi:hypothetical protein
METFLLLALGAFVVSRLGIGQETTQSDQDPLGPPPPPPPPVGPVTVPMPYTADGRMIQVSLPYAAGTMWKDYACNNPAANVYVQELLRKRQQYQDAFDAWVLAGRPTRKDKPVLKALGKAKDAYFKTFQFFIYKCKP